VLREDPNARLKIAVSGGDFSDLAGPGAGFLHSENEVFELLIPDCSANYFALFSPDYS
jgi:hypothetical protein